MSKILSGREAIVNHLSDSHKLTDIALSYENVTLYLENSAPITCEFQATLGPTNKVVAITPAGETIDVFSDMNNNFTPPSITAIKFHND